MPPNALLDPRLLELRFDAEELRLDAEDEPREPDWPSDEPELPARLLAPPLRKFGAPALPREPEPKSDLPRNESREALRLDAARSYFALDALSRYDTPLRCDGSCDHFFPPPAPRSLVPALARSLERPRSPPRSPALSPALSLRPRSPSPRSPRSPRSPSPISPSPMLISSMLMSPPFQSTSLPPQHPPQKPMLMPMAAPYQNP